MQSLPQCIYDVKLRAVEQAHAFQCHQRCTAQNDRGHASLADRLSGLAGCRAQACCAEDFEPVVSVRLSAEINLEFLVQFCCFCVQFC